MNPNSTLFRSLPHPWNLVLTHAATVLAWGLLFGLIFLLRSFFLLLFLTFVFAYIQAGGVTRLAPYLGNRTLRVVLVGLFILGILSATGIFLVPKVKPKPKSLPASLPPTSTGPTRNCSGWDGSIPC